MKKSLGLVFVYFAFQIAGAMLAMLYGAIVMLATQGDLSDKVAFEQITLEPALFLGFLFMIIYMWRAGLISKDKTTWSPVSGKYLLTSVGLYAAFLLILDFLMSRMSWLPNLLEDTFNLLQSGWLGILCIAVLGPILEELLFRGAITKTLLQKYDPAKAIIISALIFGVFHINPVQVVGASLIGLVLGWCYYKTASLIPCILLHILNNSLSVYISLNFPEEADSSLGEIAGVSDYLFLAIGVAVFALLFVQMRKVDVAYPWKKQERTEEIEQL